MPSVDDASELEGSPFHAQPEAHPDHRNDGHGRYGLSDEVGVDVAVGVGERPDGSDRLRAR